MNEEEEKLISLTKLILIVIAIWLISAILIWIFFGSWEKSGTFGDTFGFINSLFSGLALAAIIYTMYLQKKELQLQRKELQFTRKELERTADAQELTHKMINEQLRLASLPILYYSSELQTPHNCFTILNDSENPAFNVDIWIFQPISYNEITPKAFKESFINEHYKQFVNLDKFQENSSDNKTFYFSERGVYNLLSKNKKIIIPIDYPFAKTGFYTLIQYRDVLGNNYVQTIQFKYKPVVTQPFEISIAKPNFPKKSKRIDLHNPEENDTVSKLAKEYQFKFNNSIHVGYIKGKGIGSVEGRWIMIDT